MSNKFNSYELIQPCRNNNFINYPRAPQQSPNTSDMPHNYEFKKAYTPSMTHKQNGTPFSAFKGMFSGGAYKKKY